MSSPQTRTTTYPSTLHIRITAWKDYPMGSSYAYGEYAAEWKTITDTVWTTQAAFPNGPQSGPSGAHLGPNFAQLGPNRGPHGMLLGKAALLRQKGYPQSLIDEAYIKARDKNRDELLHPTDGMIDPPVKKTYMTTTYNPAYDGLRSQVKKTWDLLDRSSSTRHVHGAGLQVGYCRPKNLHDLLVRSKPPSRRRVNRPDWSTKPVPTGSVDTVPCWTRKAK